MALPNVFTSGDVFTAANANLLRSNQYNLTTSTKTANYVLVAADVGTRVLMNAAGTTTITVNTSLFAAGDTLEISNIGAGVCTITSGTCTVTSSATLALAQYASGTLFFTSASAAIFIASAGTAGGMTLLSTTTLTGATTAVTGIDQTYNSLFITVEKWYASSNAYLRLYLNGDTTSGNYQGSQIRYRGATVETNAVTYEFTGWNQTTSQTNNLNTITIPNYAGSSNKIASTYGSMTTDSAATGIYFGSNGYYSTTAITSITFAPQAGTFTAGTVKIYGVK